MAFTRPWTDNQSGTVPANTIDTLFANLRKDISERMAALFNSWSADPLVVKDAITGKKTGKKILISPHAFMLDDSMGGLDPGHEVFDNYISAPETVGPLRAPLILPIGVSIKKIRWLVYTANSGTVSMEIHSHAFTVGNTKVTEHSMTKASSGMEIKDSGNINLLISDTKIYSLYIDKSGDDITQSKRLQLHGVEITYDTPDSRNTL